MRVHIPSSRFKFDDERVTRAYRKDVFEGTFGGKDHRSIPQAHGKMLTSSFFRSSNACKSPAKSRTRTNLCNLNIDMLLYIRDSEREQILAPVLPEEIPSHLREKFEKQEAEKAAKKKEKAEAHLYLELKVEVFSSQTCVNLFD